MCDQLKSISRQRLSRIYRDTVQPEEIERITFVLRQLICTR
jgi:hypothetical protein